MCVFIMYILFFQKCCVTDRFSYKRKVSKLMCYLLKLLVSLLLYNLYGNNLVVKIHTYVNKKRSYFA